MPAGQGNPSRAAQQPSQFQVFALAFEEHDAVFSFARILAIEVLQTRETLKKFVFVIASEARQSSH